MRFQPVAPAAALLSAALLAPAALAQTAVPTETAQHSAATVTLHLHPFLQPGELAILRQLAGSEAAMQAFLSGRPGHAAIAAHPAQGFFRNGQPVASATAMADLPDPESARREASANCQRLSRQRSACVILLEATPRP